MLLPLDTRVTRQALRSLTQRTIRCTRARTWCETDSWNGWTLRMAFLGLYIRGCCWCLIFAVFSFHPSLDLDFPVLISQFERISMRPHACEFSQSEWLGKIVAVHETMDHRL